jgi:hypothetical protein
VNDGLKNLLSKTNRNGKMESIGNYSRFIEFTTSSIDFCRNRNKKKLDESDSIENDHCELCFGCRVSVTRPRPRISIPITLTIFKPFVKTLREDIPEVD